MKQTKTERLLKFLKTGADITEGQAASRFGIRNLSAAASALRYQGYAVYANSKTFTTGKKATVYRLGTPSRAVVAAGYRALAA